MWAKILFALFLLCGLGAVFFERILDHVALDASPHYVFLRSANVNMRSGPHKEYPCIHTYTCKNLPMKILKEHEEWLLVSDMYGAEGWIHRALCSKRRRYVVTQKTTQLYSKPSVTSQVIAVIDPCVCLLYKRPRRAWLRVYVRHEGALFRGWVHQDTVWGS